MFGLKGVKGLAQGDFLIAFAIVPRAALQRHMQHIIADEMRGCACVQQTPIGRICAQSAQVFGAVDACLGKLCLRCGAKIWDAGNRGFHALDRRPVAIDRCRALLWLLILLLLLLGGGVAVPLLRRA